MKTMLRHDHLRYEVTEQRTHLLVLRLSDAELHARSPPTPCPRSPPTPRPPPKAVHTLFEAVLRAARERASDDPDLMLQVQDMDTPDALAALKKAFLPSDMIEPIADALPHLAPHTYAPDQLNRPVPTRLAVRPRWRGCGA